MIKKIILGLLLGIALVSGFMQFDPLLHRIIEQELISFFQERFNCHVHGTLVYFSWAHPLVVFKDIQCWKSDNSWSWTCPEIEISFSWSHFFQKKVIEFVVQCNKAEIKSTCTNGYPLVLDHINDFFQEASFSLPLALKSISFYKSKTFLSDNANQLDCYWSSRSKKIGNVLKTSVSIHDAILSMDKKNICNQSKGSVFVDTYFVAKGKPEYNVVVDIQSYLLACARLQEPYAGHCSLTGRWNKNHGRFQLHNNDHSCAINPIIITKTDQHYQFQAQSSFPLETLLKFVPVPACPLTGNVHCSVQGSYEHIINCSGNVLMYDCKLHPSSFWNLTTKIEFEKNDNQWQTFFSMREPSIGHIEGSGKGNTDLSCYSIDMKNSTALAVPYLKSEIAPAQFNCTLDKQPGKNGLLSYQLQTNASSALFESHGLGEWTNAGLFNIKGSINKDNYLFHGNMHQWPYLYGARYINKQHTSLLWVDYKDNSWFEGGINFSLLRTAINNYFHYNLQAEGVVQGAWRVTPEKIFGKVFLAESSNIRLPETYNFIKNFTTLWEFKRSSQRLCLYNFFLELYSGTVTSKELFVGMKNNSIEWYMPFIFNQCLFNVTRDLFAMMSGSLVYKKQNEQEELNAHIMIDRAQLKENIFSLASQKQLTTVPLINVPIKCNVCCETKEPIKIDTPFMQADAHALLYVEGSLDKPQVHGSILIPTGLLKFPYKPLYINQALLQILPDQVNNPMIDLIAQNRIRNYDVRLNVSGSLHDHCILLSSNPPLSQEQIVGLLLIGSSQDSFNTLMPALLMNNVRGLLFGSSKSSMLTHLFKSYPQSLSINLVPSFTDQTGRGGLRGAIEITVNDRLRALIQKNFNLTEDTRFELEYFVTDDITVRAIRDERSDIGAEIEMRWKF